MAFSETSSPSNQAAVISAIRTFATANGWSEEHFVSSGSSVNGRGVLSLSRGDTVVTFRWDGTDADNIGMYHALAYPAGLTADEKERPWDFATDSGSGNDSLTTLAADRRVSTIGAGPYIKLTLFSGSSDGYVHCVLEHSVGKYRHFGFGDVLEEKIGNWTGGGWVGGGIWAGSTQASQPVSSSHSILFDGLTALGEDSRATLHCRGLAGQVAADRFGVSSNSGSDPADTDQAGNNRTGIHGGLRTGVFDVAFLQFIPDPLSGVIELAPALLFNKQRGSDRFQALGFVPGVRMCQIKNFDAGDEVTVGSDTWKFFPVASKANIGGTNEESDNMGLAYLKVT